jgi:hypothetical protein
MIFSKFEGENPRLWQSRCESYFDMYNVDEYIWVKVASMHFEGPAARWLQSIDHKIPKASWSELCSWIHERFAKDEHELLIRQLYKIKQSGSVQEYIDKFAKLVDQLKAYSSSMDPLYYTTRFVDGLREEIKQSIIVQHPKDLDTACCLALLQLENMLAMKEVKKFEGTYHAKPYCKGPMPLPLHRPPLQPKQDNIQEDRNKTTVSKGQSVEDKLAALAAYRTAKGLCHMCGEKWFRNHKCSNLVQLNVIHEVWDLIDAGQTEEINSQGDSVVEECFMALLEAVAMGKGAPRTLKLSGIIQEVEVLILINSGSSHRFISEQVASSLLGVSPSAQLTLVNVVNGQIVQSHSELLQAKWSV